MNTFATHSSNSLVRLGRTWFQWRGLSPLVWILPVVVLTPDFKWTGFGWVWLVVLAVVLELFRVWAVGYAGGATRTRGDTIPALIHSGPFRFVRNPLYIANIGLYTLTGVLFGFTYLSVLIFCYASVQYMFIVSYEESQLTKTFGPMYSAYFKAVPRWFPSLSPRIRSSAHRFDLKTALRSERSTFYVILALVAVYFLKANFF